MIRDVALSLIQLAGVLLVLLGAFLVSIPAGIAVSGLALLTLGWALDRS